MSQTLPFPTYSDDRPRRDSPPRKRLRGADVIVRAATAELLRTQMRPGITEAVEDVIERVYDRCPATLAYVARAATSPAMTTTVGWAAELVATSTLDFLASEMPASAFAQLTQRGVLTVTPEAGAASVKVPARQSPLVLQGGWIGEGNAKPVVTIPLSSVTISPYKLATISTFTEEMLLASVIEQLVRQALAHDLTGLLDTALLDSTAASSVRPAGLFNGVTPLTASTATPASEAMAKDLAALHGALATGHPEAEPIYIMNPAQALRVPMLSPASRRVVTSGYLPAGSVAAIDADAIVLLVGQPAFAMSRNVALHMESATPLPLGTGTQGEGVLAVPMRSSFQEDWVGLRCVLRAGWAKRRSGAAAIVTGATW